jgi:hypothetical protein
MVIHPSSHNGIRSPQLRKADPGVEFCRAYIKTGIIKCERPIELEDPPFTGQLLFLIGVQVFGPPVTPNVDKDVVQTIVIGTYHATFNG